MTAVSQALAQLQTDLAAVPTRRSGDGPLLKVHTDVTALAAAIAALPPIATVTVTAPPTPPAFIKPGGYSWTDAKGLVWSLNTSGTILQNGSSAAAHGWQSDLGMGVNGEFYIVGQDMNVYGWNGAWQIVPYVSSTTPINVPPPPPPLSAFFVSPTGSDSNPGSRAAPFLTLEMAQTAMRGQPLSGIKTTVLLAGTFNRTGTLAFTSADSGTTWRYDPLGSVNTAILDGGSSVTDGIVGNGAGINNITINGIKVTNFTHLGIYFNGPDGSTTSGNMVINCEVSNLPNPPPVENIAAGPAGIAISNSTSCNVLNNYVHNVGGAGIMCFAFDSGTSLDGLNVSGNVLLNCAIATSDGGALYCSMHATNTSGGNIALKNNFIRDFGLGSTTYGTVMAIYLDDNCSNATVSGNILGCPTVGFPGSGTDPHNGFALSNNSANCLVNGGTNNTFSGNIIDVGATSRQATADLYNSFAGNNTFQGNIVLSKFTGGLGTSSGAESGFAYYNTAAKTVIQNNLYNNYASGGSTFSNGDHVSDSNPVLTDPFISGATYTIAQNSPAFLAPVNFAPIVGGWGPPGFVIPDNGNRSPS